MAAFDSTFARVQSALPERLPVALETPKARVAALAVLTAVAMVSRFWMLGTKSIWLDEALSWRAARVPLSDLPDFVGAHPPLYFGLLHFWLKIAGDSEVALRAPSAIAGAATVVLLALVASRIGGVLLGALAAAMLLLNSTYLYFSQEARMYALAGLLSLAATVALAGFIARPSLIRLAAYTALGIVLIYTHYTGFVVLAAHAGVVAAYGIPKLWRERNPQLLGGALIAFAIMYVAYLPWLSHFRQHERLGVPHMPEPTWNLVWTTLQGALGLERVPSSWLWQLLALPLLALGVFGIARRWRDPLTVSLGALALVPVGQLLISIQVTKIFSLRQVSPFIPALVFVLALGLVEAVNLFAHLNRAGRLVGAAVALAIAGALLGFMFKGFAATYTSPPLEDWRAATEDLRSFDGLIYVTASYAMDPFTYYYGSPPHVQTFGLWSPEKLPAGQKAVVVVSHQPLDYVLTALGTNVAVGAQRNYRGIAVLEVSTLHHTTLNVDIPLDQADSGWTVNAQGYIESASDASSFACSCELDADGDGLADEPFTIVLEYLDAGAAQARLLGVSSGVVLATEPTSGTGRWRRLAVDVPARTPVAAGFALSRGVVLRRLQVVRTRLENADVFGSYQGATRWLLGSDGYIQSADQYSYINSTLDVDPDKNGTIDQPFVFVLEYRGNASSPPSVFGLRPGKAWEPVQQDARVIHTGGEWQTIQVTVPAGEQLQPRFYVGRGVLVGRVAFLPAAE